MDNYVQIKKWGEMSSRYTYKKAQKEDMVCEKINFNTDTKNENMNFQNGKIPVDIAENDLKSLIEDNVEFVKRVTELLGEIALVVIDKYEKNNN